MVTKSEKWLLKKVNINKFLYNSQTMLMPILEHALEYLTGTLKFP